MMARESRAHHGTPRPMLVYAIISDAVANQLTDIEVPYFGKIGSLEYAGTHYAVGSWLDEGNVSVDLTEQANAYSLAIDKLFELGDIVPIRFGSWLNRKQLDDYAHEYKTVHQASLHRVRHCAEVNAHWSFPNDADENAPSLTSGHDYLMNKVKQASYHRRCEELAGRVQVSIQNELCGAYRESVVTTRVRADQKTVAIAKAPILVVSLRVLVERVSVDKALQSLADSLIDDRGPIVVTGPLPPYSFATCKVVQRTAA